MSTKNQKVLYAIKNNPLLIGSLLKDTSINKGMIYRELHKAIPCRIGIEFELSGDFRKGFINKYHKGTIETHPVKLYEAMDHPVPIRYNSKDKKSLDYIMAKHYGVYEIIADSFKNVSAEDLYEIRVSIKDYHQLKGLYKFMQDLPEFCKLHENGGIHIHVDISEYYPIHKPDNIAKYIRNNLKIVSDIFPKYTGHYNKREVGVQRKATYVNMSGKKSLEYRIAPLTFDYNKLITWVIDCVKFRNKIIQSCRLSKTPPESKLISSKYKETDDNLRWVAIGNTTTDVVSSINNSITRIENEISNLEYRNTNVEFGSTTSY